MQSFKVIDPKGVLHDGAIVEKGGVIASLSDTAQVKAWLHFGQVEEVESKSQPKLETKEKSKESDKAKK